MQSWKRFQLGWFRLTLEELRNASDFVETAIQRHRADLDARAEESKQTMSPEDWEQYVEFLSDEAYQIREVFPQTLRRALLVTAMSMLEVELERFCNRHKAALKLAIGPEDIGGKGIFQSQRYLKKAIQIAFPDQTREWTEIGSLSRLRNAIVHRDGHVKDDNAELRRFIQTWDSLELVNDEIVLHRDFLPHVIDVFERFWALLTKGQGQANAK
jgi:hypothetical protein